MAKTRISSAGFFPTNLGKLCWLDLCGRLSAWGKGDWAHSLGIRIAFLQYPQEKQKPGSVAYFYIPHTSVVFVDDKSGQPDAF